MANAATSNSRSKLTATAEEQSHFIKKFFFKYKHHPFKIVQSPLNCIQKCVAVKGNWTICKIIQV